MNSPIIVLLSISLVNGAEIFKIGGDVTIALTVKNCRNNTLQSPFVTQSLINSAIWTVQRLNSLEFAAPLTFGLSVHEICADKEIYKTLFGLFERHGEDFIVGTVGDFDLKPKMKDFSEVLGVRTARTSRYPSLLVKASLEVLTALGWKNNVTVVSPSEEVVRDFFEISKKRNVCVKDYYVYERDACGFSKNSSGVVVVFGDHYHLNIFKQGLDEDLNVLFVPLDGSVINDLPPNCYVVVPLHAPLSLHYQKTASFLPTPLLFEVAAPILSYAQDVWLYLVDSCNSTSYKLNCLRSNFQQVRSTCWEPCDILDVLKIETLQPDFVYNVFRGESASQPYQKIFTYSIFGGNLTVLDSSLEVNNNSVFCSNCQDSCKNFQETKGLSVLERSGIGIRNESWVFAFLAISSLGNLFCFAILLFLLTSLCRRDILEGNPVLTVLLLFTVMLMYISILPFSLEPTNKAMRNSVCLARALTVTLSYSSALSLILSRCIVLATASKEIGFMSHVAGPVQSFLCLFIFGVQAALSLQLIGRCSDVFRGVTFVYLLSYNVMLLLLLLCISPLVVKSQRNYREGKYFTIAAVIISCLWCLWIPAYALLDEKWKDPILCFGLATTASTLLGSVFVPRTYLMTIAAARDKIASALPSLATATSAMDIYRASSQPVYDCVNVAAINAVTLARAGVAHIQQSDLYSCPNLPDDDDFDLRCDTPVHSDKVTRF